MNKKPKFDPNKPFEEVKPKFDPSKPFDVVKEESKPSEQVETAARGGFEMATLGLSEPAISGANAVIGNMIDAGFDTNTIKDFLSKSTDIESIKKVYGQDVERRKALEEKYPGSNIAGQVVGGLAPIGPASMVFKGGQAFAKTLPFMAEKAGEGLLKKGVRGALGGGLGAAGATEAQNIAESSTGFIEPEQEMKPEGAGVIGAALGATPSVLRGAGKGLKNVAKVGFSTVTGVSPKLTTEALSKPELLKGVASPLEEIKAGMDQAVQSIQDKAAVEKLNITDDIVSSVDQLKQKVSEGSGKAYELLTSRVEMLPLKPTKQAVRDAINSVKIMGKGPVGEAAKGALERLESLEKDLNEIGEHISLDQAKKLIQQLDQDISYSQRAGQYTDTVDRAYSKVRQGIDGSIKSLVPEYAERMKEVASNTQLLKEVSKKFGDQAGLYRSIDKLESNASQLDRALLDRLGSETGKNFSTYFDNFSEIYKPLGALKPGSTENAIKSLMKGNSIETKALIEKLGQSSDQDFVSMIDQLKIQSAFDKPFQIGSRNVNLWTIMLSAGGGTIGGLPLAAIGSAIGATIDRYGPAMAKKILIGISKIEGLPTVKKIQNLDLPDPVKSYLSETLMKEALVGYRTGAPVSVPDHAKLSMEKDIIDSDSLSYTEKAKNLNALYKKGHVLDAQKLIDDLPRKKERALRVKPESEKPSLVKNKQNFIMQKKPDDL